jgi:transcriptional regulator with XRE-family HTH domain
MGERLANGRRFWGLDLQGVANRTGLDVERIAAIESGEASPSFAEVFWLSRLYRVSLDYLASLKPGPRQAQGSPAGAGTFVEVLDQVRVGARNGALSVVTDDLLVRAAEEHAVHQLVEALLNQGEIGKPHVWGLEVGRNEASRLQALEETRRTVPFEDQAETQTLDVAPDEESDEESGEKPPPFLPDLNWLGRCLRGGGAS